MDVSGLAYAACVVMMSEYLRKSGSRCVNMSGHIKGAEAVVMAERPGSTLTTRMSPYPRPIESGIALNMAVDHAVSYMSRWRTSLHATCTATSYAV
jgi:hypothetical protein